MIWRVNIVYLNVSVFTHSSASRHIEAARNPSILIVSHSRVDHDQDSRRHTFQANTVNIRSVDVFATPYPSDEFLSAYSLLVCLSSLDSNPRLSIG